MHCLLIVSLLFFFDIMNNYIVVAEFDLQSIKDDLNNFNVRCADDNCQNNEEDSLSSRACHCGKHCTHLGTCCLDSPYVGLPQPEKKIACREVYKGESYFMVDQCQSYDSVWASLCNDESSGDDDVQNIIPVTSLITFVTYKNYYCFQCHEESDDFMYWQLKVHSTFALNETLKNESKSFSEDISFIYDKESETIMASFYDNGTDYFPLRASLEVPSELKNWIHVCESNVISSCLNDFYDDDVRDKCELYMAIKRIKKFGTIIKYKNTHCALCNDESLSDVLCKTIERDSYGGGYGSHRRRPGGGFGGHRRKPGGGYNRFTFTYLLDINRSDGELVGMIQKCSEDHIWDRFAKKCRKLTCALPGFKIKNRKCVQE